MVETEESIMHISLLEILKEKGVLTYRISGKSMLPLLRPQRDLVTVRNYDGTGLKKYDIAMYYRPFDHHFVLHRVVEVYDGYYTFLGDGCAEKEYHIPEQIIVAVLESFERNGKVISVDNAFIKIYGKIHYFLLPIRRILYRIRRCIVRIPFMKKIYNIIRLKIVV